MLGSHFMGPIYPWLCSWWCIWGSQIYLLLPSVSCQHQSSFSSQVLHKNLCHESLVLFLTGVFKYVLDLPRNWFESGKYKFNHCHLEVTYHHVSTVYFGENLDYSCRPVYRIIIINLSMQKLGRRLAPVMVPKVRDPFRLGHFNAHVIWCFSHQ